MVLCGFSLWMCVSMSGMMLGGKVLMISVVMFSVGSEFSKYRFVSVVICMVSVVCRVM